MQLIYKPKMAQTLMLFIQPASQTKPTLKVISHASKYHKDDLSVDNEKLTLAYIM